MQFHFHKVDKLPKLAWCAVMQKGREILEIFHGPWVETQEYFFAEGAWDGKFSEGGFAESCVFMGSGAHVTGDKVVFSTPCHVFERLHVMQVDSRLYISNSLAFLLKESDTRLDLNYIPYQTDLLSIRNGLSKYKRTIPTLDGGKIYIYFYCNIEVDIQQKHKEIKKQVPPEFDGFESYRNFLNAAMLKIHANANSVDRVIKYSPITTISSGYDSPASSVIAKNVGCDRAVTFRDAREEYKFNNDSGMLIAEKLGLHVKEFGRRDYLTKDGYPEAEFLASGNMGHDLPMSAFEADFRQRLVITGFFGGCIWDRHLKPRKDIADFTDFTPDGTSLADFRLRVGFVHLPLPSLGCFNRPSIHKISNSMEMQQWFTKNSYDRPIPRRIVEERGIDRQLFGQKKKAVTVFILWTAKQIAREMKPASFQSFENYYQLNKKSRNFKKQLFYRTFFRFYLLYHNTLERRIVRKLLPFSVRCPIPERFQVSPDRQSFFIHWGIAEIRDTYDTGKS